MRPVLATLFILFGATAGLADTTEISVHGGNAVYLPDSELMVYFAAVEDQRCPSAADCVWEGLIRVELELAIPGDTPETIVLCNACDGATRSAIFGNYTLTMVRLEPGRDVLDPMGRTPLLADYTLVLGGDWQ